MDIKIKSRPFTPLEIPDLLNGNSEFLTGFTKEQLARIKAGLRGGQVRRFAAIVNHQKLNFSHNALIAWNKPSLSQELAERLKAKEYISHIYLRKAHRLFPFGLYTMIHGQNQVELEAYIQELSGLLCGCKFKVLKTIKEFKKTSFNPYPRSST